MQELPTQNEPRTRVAFFLPDLTMGGAERVFLTLASALARRGYAVELILARKHGALLAEVDPKVTLVNLDTYRPNGTYWVFGLRTAIQLAHYLTKNPPVILFSTLTGANLTAILAHLLTRRRFHLCIREAATLTNVKSRARLCLMRLLYPLANCIIVLTDHMQNELRVKLKLPLEKIMVIGNPVDAEKINYLARESALVSEARQLNPYAICVGRMTGQKDFHTAIMAIYHLNQTSTLNLVLVGDGPMKQELQMLAQQLGIENRVHFVGLQTNPYVWIAEAMVFVLSSRWEGYPNVLLEAQCLGIPIVATQYDDSVKTLLHDPGHDQIVGVGNNKAMASAIQRATDIPNKVSGINKNRQFEDILTAYMNLIPALNSN